MLLQASQVILSPSISHVKDQDGDASGLDNLVLPPSARSAHVHNEPARADGELARVSNEPARADGEPARVDGEPARADGEPARVDGEPASVDGEPARVDGEPARVDGEPERVDGEPALVDDGRVDEEQEPASPPACAPADYSRVDALHQSVDKGGVEAPTDSVQMPPEREEEERSEHVDVMETGLVITPEMAATLPVVAVVTFEYEAVMEDELTLRPG